MFDDPRQRNPLPQPAYTKPGACGWPNNRSAVAYRKLSLPTRVRLKGLGNGITRSRRSDRLCDHAMVVQAKGAAGLIENTGGLFRPVPEGRGTGPFRPHWSLLRTEVVPFAFYAVSERYPTDTEP